MKKGAKKSKRPAKKAKDTPEEPPPSDAAGIAGGPANNSRTLFSELPQPVKSWDGMFDLYQEKDGSFRAEFGRDTAPLSLLLLWKIDIPERDISFALMLVAESEAESPTLDRFIAERLRSAVSADIQKLMTPGTTDAERKKARRTLQRLFTTSLSALELRGKRDAHKSTATVTYNAADGIPRTVPLSWALLECGRALVQETQDLPSKRDLRERVKSDFPGVDTFSVPQWSASFKDAGLSALPRADDW